MLALGYGRLAFLEVTPLLRSRRVEGNAQDFIHRRIEYGLGYVGARVLNSNRILVFMTLSHDVDDTLRNPSEGQQTLTTITGPSSGLHR